MTKIIIFISFLISFTAISAETFLFNMDFSIYHNREYKYHFDFYQGSKGLIIKRKVDGVQLSNHNINSDNKSSIIALTPFAIKDSLFSSNKSKKPLLYLSRVGKDHYKITFPKDMMDSKWDKIYFTVSADEAISEDGFAIKKLTIGDIIRDSYFGQTFPVGISKITAIRK